jgi:tRNA nucleotidyltransferase (CCA-adding enzyme)
MQDSIEKVCTTAMREITPTKEERRKIASLAGELEAKVVSACEQLNIKADVRVEGSVAKDTWLCGEPDIDVFMRVSSEIPRKSLGKVCLKAARKATEGSKQVERFAEHPYLEAFVEGVRVNIVPCYAVKQGEWLSATDRTPFHTDYVRKHLDGQMHGQVRLLKKFMKGIGVYGAEIKVGGFSGYLCELLVSYYEGFLSTLRAFAKYQKRMVVDIEDHYRNRENELGLLFKEPLVVVDPIDRGRNVASAVQAQKLHTFVAAARVFLANPDRKFFYPPETVAPSPKELKRKLIERGSAIVAVVFGRVNLVPDILWGQLYKSQRSLHNLLRANDFNVLRDVVWSDERTLNALVFEVEQRCLPLVKKHSGPPLELEDQCGKFVRKHLNELSTVSGPSVEDGRWVVEIKRKYVDVVALLNEMLHNGGRNAGVAEQLSYVLRKGFKVLVNAELIEAHGKNRSFRKFLSEFLVGKPAWLEAA